MIISRFSYHFFANTHIYTFMFQWTYITGNSWGIDEKGQGCVGCGRVQEHFRACADIRITDVAP